MVSITPTDQTSGRLGVDFTVRFRDGTQISSATVYVDSGTPRQRVLTVEPAIQGYDAPNVSGPAFADTAGDHVFTIVATGGSDTVGTSVHFSRTFTLQTAAYTAVVLPDLGAGAGVRGVSAAGVVSGWVTDHSGRKRAAVWTNGALSFVSTPDTVDLIAVQTDAVGDVLIQVGPQPSYVTWEAGSVRVRRPDGTTIVLPSVSLPVGLSLPSPTSACCAIAAAINDRREVLAYSEYFPLAYSSAVFDAATGAAKDSVPQRLLLLNNAGQMLGLAYSTEGFGYDSHYPVAVGFTLPPGPDGPTLPGCDPVGRWSTTDAVALDDAANVLLNACGNLAYDGAGGSAWLDQYFGRVVRAVLSPQGTWVVGLQARTGTLYRWQAATHVAEVIGTAGRSWQIDSLAAVNTPGQIAAHAVDRATGRSAALLLTPAQ